MSSRTTLKTYFLTGSTPTEAQFADLIDSVLILDEDLVNDFSSTSSTDALTANAGKVINDSLTSLDTRVVTLENASTSYLANYYTKAEIDTSVTNLGVSIDGKASTSSVTDLTNKVSTLETSIEGKANSSHTHTASNITDLQPLLDDKASITFVNTTKTYIEGLISAIDPEIDLNHLGDFTALAARVLAIENDYVVASQLSQKAEASHTHSVSQISDLDLNQYYDKSAVDTLLSNVEPKAHTHVESDITDLDKYTQAETNLQITDHSAKTNNPHGVTKDQVGLGNVANLSVADLFQTSEAQLLATKAELNAVSPSGHIANKSNPHEVTKAQVSLGNVPNIDVNALLTAHLAANNPHNIDSSYLDVYTQAETQAKIEENYDAHRYAFKPATPTDGGGAVGDIAYHADGLYFKFGPAEWREILLSKTFSGLGYIIDTPIFEITNNSNSIFKVDSSTDTTNINTSITKIGGSTFNTFEVSDLFKIQKTSNTSVTNIDTAVVSIGNDLRVAGTLGVGGATTLASTLSAGATTVSSLNAGSGAIQTTGTLSAGATTTTSLNAGSGAIQTTGTLSSGSATVSSLSAGSGAIQTSGTITGGAVSGTSLSTAGQASVGSLASTGAITGTDLTLSGDLTVNGTTTSIDTTNLLIEDNVVVLNKNQTGTPQANLQSGFEVERGNAGNAKFYWDEASDKWKAIMQINGSMVTKTVTFTDHTHGNITETGKIGSAANKPLITTTGGVVTTGAFGTSANNFCEGNDSRLTDTRTPKSHTHGLSDITDSGTAAALNVPTSGNAGTSEVVKGNDTRLTDTRTPKAHTHAMSEVTGLASALSPIMTRSQIEALLYSV